MHATTVKTVAICDTEPISIEGLRAMLEPLPDLRVVGAETSLINAMDMVRLFGPSLVVIDKAFGIHAVMDWIRRIRNTGTSALVWGMNMSDAEAMRIVQAGATGVIRKSADLSSLMEAIRTVADGNTWMEECLVRENDRAIRGHRSNLTGRELQVLELVEQGMRNKDIGTALGIQAGTVKIHLKHIFEKTGIRGRYGLALTGLKEKGLLSLPTM
ncbi:MAG TPA: response regulator transcription factor [Bryobacteraceae bacterium]|nr:response regulator transcription factor [Bryobacteraceae bacterium]